MKTAYCFLIGCISIYATCNKRIDCKQTIYSFEANYKAYPALDSIHINDTIWLELNVPTQLKDLASNQLVDYSGAENFGTSIQYVELKGGDLLTPGGIPAANYFNNYLIEGNSISSDNPDLVRGFRCKEESNMYKLKLGIIPMKKGVFFIAPSDAANVYRKSDKCTKASFSLTFKDTNQHLYLYRQSRPGYEPSSYEQSHGYYFKVY